MSTHPAKRKNVKEKQLLLPEWFAKIDFLPEIVKSRQLVIFQPHHVSCVQERFGKGLTPEVYAPWCCHLGWWILGG